MPLVKAQPLAIGFSGGLSTKADSKTVPSTKLLDLQNAVFTKQTTLSKRNGYRALGQSIDDTIDALTGEPARLSAPVGLASRADELIAFDGAYAYSHRASSDTWTRTGEVSSVVCSDAAIARTGTAQTVSDHADNLGIRVVAWEDSRGGVWFSVLERDGGHILIADTQLDSGGISPRCLPVGTQVHVYWANAANRRIWCVVIDPANPTVMPTVTPLANDLDPANPVYDACATVEVLQGIWTSGRPAMLAWTNSSGGFTVAFVAQSGVIGSALTGFPAAVHSAATVVPGAIACMFDTTANLLGAAVLIPTTGNQIQIWTYDPDLSPLGTTSFGAAGNALVRATVAYDGTGTIWFAAERDNGATNLATIEHGSMADGVITTMRGHGLATRAFVDGSDIYVGVAHGVKFYPYVAVCRMNTQTWGVRSVTSARLLPGLSTGLPTRHMLPTVAPVDFDANYSSRQHAVTLGYRIQLASDATTSTNFGEAGIKRVVLDYDNDNSYQTASLGKGLYLAGALIQHYDGARWAEAGFHAAPDVATAALSTASPLSPVEGVGGSITAGTYGYVACYEEVDNAGELHSGPTSVISNITVVGASAAVTLTIPTCRLTGKKNVRIAVFRSANGSSAEFFRVTSTDPMQTTGANRFLLNDPTVDTLTFVDAVSDATLTTLQPCYTNGGILSNDPAPSAGGCIAGGKYRLFWTDPSDPDIVRYSQSLDELDDAMAESAALSLRVDPYGGSIVGLGVLDDAVVVFKETATHVFAGPGPDADGGSATAADAFTPSALLSSDVGCSSPKSIVQTTVGLMFATSKGLCLMGRDRQVVTQVGDDVYGFKDQIVSRATLLPDRHQIVFLTAAGSTLLFDYEHGQWSRFTNHLGYDATIVDGTYHYLRTDGRVFEETPGLYADDNAHIPMLISTAWIKMAGYLQGFQKALWAGILGTYKSSHQLQMRYRIDYQDGWSAPRLANVDSVYGPSVYGAGVYGAGVYGGTPRMDTVYQWKWHINRRCQAVAFEFVDVETVAQFGASFELSELLITGGVLGARYPVGASRSG